MFYKNDFTPKMNSKKLINEADDLNNRHLKIILYKDIYNISAHARLFSVHLFLYSLLTEASRVFCRGCAPDKPN